MNCREAQELLHPYVDRELDLVNTVNIEQHFRNCTRCAAAQQSVVALRSSIGDGSLYHRAPVGLEHRIRAGLPRAGASSLWIGRFMRPGGAIAAMLLVAAALWLTTQQFGGSAPRLLASEVASAHIRSLMAEHLWDVKSTDQHTVKPWFDGKLDFAPDVRDFALASFALEGGRLDYLAGRPVAALVYRHQKHYVNLFIWPAPAQPDQPEALTTQQGYALLHWTQAGMNYWAVSDTAPDTLRQFAKLLRERPVK